MAVQRLEPAPDETGVPVDTPLRLWFGQRPSVVGAGAIEVREVGGGGVHRWELDRPETWRRNIGGAVDDCGRPHMFVCDPVGFGVDEPNCATIHPPAALDYGRRYEVCVAPEVFGEPETIQWRFSTRSIPPDRQAGRLTVGSGSADFRTVQGAIDHVPEPNRRRVVIDISPGDYRELNYVPATKPFITVRGRSREHTVIRYANNDARNGKPTIPDSRCPCRRLDKPDRYNCWRANFGVEASDFTLENITLENTTPAGGSQAEVFRCNAPRITLTGVTLRSFQDTARLQGSVFVDDSLIEGDTDFVWGTGAVHIRGSELRWLRPGPLAQLRNGPDLPGAVFVDCRLTRTSAVPDASCRLARTDASVFGHSQVYFIDTAMDRHIHPVGWELRHPDSAAGVRFAEYGSTDLSGDPIDTRGRHRSSGRLGESEATHWRDPRTVLAGWDPT